MGLPVLTGRRRNEILELQWDDLGFDSGKMRLRDNKAGTRMTQCPAAMRPAQPTDADAMERGIA